MPSSVAAMISDDVTVLGSTSGARLLLTGKEAIRLNTGFAWAGSAAVATSASAPAASLWSTNLDCLRAREKRRSEASSVGKEWGSTCRSRWWRYNKKKNKRHT